MKPEIKPYHRILPVLAALGAMLFWGLFFTNLLPVLSVVGGMVILGVFLVNRPGESGAPARG